MPTNPNKLNQFWLELKRRKVVRVIMVYAATAFVILELVDIITEPFGLPDWTLRFIVVILAVGFIVSIIFSWIYDIHPDGGIVKTEPANKVKEEEKPVTSKNWQIASYISFLVIVALILLNIISRTDQHKGRDIVEKSVAVLPFTSLSDDPEKQYLADGVMDAILLHLSKIEDLRVMSRTSVEQYRVTEKKATEICQELDVTYLLEGSFRKYGDQARLIVQLIQSGKEDHAWANQYDREWKDIFTVESEVAKSIAQEVKAVITYNEKELIEKKQTNNLEAYDYYLLGQNYYKNSTRDADLWKAIEYYKRAIALDSTYALAYSGIAGAYLLLKGRALLSPAEAFPLAKTFAMKALDLNQELEDAHCILGNIFFSFEYDFASAEMEYIRALEINPNSHTAHLSYASFLSNTGRFDEALSHADLALKLDPLAGTKFARFRILFNAGYEYEALKLAEELRDLHPDNPYNYWWCAVFYTELGMHHEAISMLQTQITYMENDNIADEIGLLGYNYGQLGQKDMALKYLVRLDELSAKGFYVAPRSQIWIYIGINNTDKAIEILEKSYKNRTVNPYNFKGFVYDNLRNEPRFIELQKKDGITE